MTDILDGILENDLQALAHNDSDGANRLPFPSLYVFWRNGQPALKQLGGAAFFGGFAIPESSLTELGLAAPAGWARGEYEKDGETRASLTNRVLAFAPFAGRRWWSAKDGTKHGQPAKGLSPNLQVLAAVKLEKGGALLPAVVNFSGWQVSHYTKAVTEWTASINKYARELTAQKVGPFAFWCTFGTFGDKPLVDKVGTGNNVKEINPVQAVIPADYGLDNLRSRFIGVDNLRQCATWKQQAADWLKHYQTAQTVPPAPPADWPPSDEAF